MNYSRGGKVLVQELKSERRDGRAIGGSMWSKYIIHIMKCHNIHKKFKLSFKQVQVRPGN